VNSLTYTVTLPAGLRLLNSNQRPHYRIRHEVTKELRAAAHEAVTDHPALMDALAVAKPGPLFQRAHVLGILRPPSARRADPANWYPSFKAAVDGLVDAGLLDDDDHTRLVGPDMRLGEKVKGGQLILVIRGLAVGEDPLSTTGVAA
jgi:crossover junction endodeoxyribonuclease RusA